MKYAWDEDALEDLEEATRFYFQRDPQVEIRFAECIDNAIEQVTSRPISWPIIESDVRSFVVEIFPYSLLYTIDEDHIVILAVAHHSRHPEYWKDRIN
jgi:plasmid stabilization system protein ParE